MSLSQSLFTLILKNGPKFILVINPNSKQENLMCMPLTWNHIFYSMSKTSTSFSSILCTSFPKNYKPACTFKKSLKYVYLNTKHYLTVNLSHIICKSFKCDNIVISAEKLSSALVFIVVLTIIISILHQINISHHVNLRLTCFQI